jgi:hypothetical protein
VKSIVSSFNFELDEKDNNTFFSSSFICRMLALVKEGCVNKLVKGQPGSSSVKDGMIILSC